MSYLTPVDAGNGIPETSGLDSNRDIRRVLLLIAPAGAISESLIHAIEREFSWVVIEQVRRIEDACVAFRYSVSLILVDAVLLQEAEAAAVDLQQSHPSALTAVIELNAHKPVCSLSQIFDSNLVRGILPMNLRLDLWLSVIRLMLRGGEYFPGEMFRPNALGARDSSFFPRGLSVAPAWAAAGGNNLSELTTREIQILEMVARGLQNKSIAAELRLSESTIKIHLHNIIRKLGVHNRTEAAARFRDHRDRKPSPPMRNPTSTGPT